MAGESVGLVVIVEDEPETLGLLERALTPDFDSWGLIF